tara:strand:- start:12 stop:500 length:489 start_codon:yes stop_codon:yes gene_type:complete
MFKFLKVFLFFILFFNCQNIKSKRLPVKIDSVSYFSYGTGFDLLNVVSMDYLIEKVENSPDSVQLKVKGKIIDVCSKKGCWMTIELPNKQELMVRFKDYGFFVPLDSSGEAIINGLAYINNTSVDELRHFAKDAGASINDIESIVEPKITYNFMADGVLLAK